MEHVAAKRLDLSKSPYDLTTFFGRVKHYAWVTDPRLAFVPKNQLIEAKDLVEKYKKGLEPTDVTDTQVRRAQQLHLSAFHPDSGQLQNFVGRMSFQVPGGMILIGAMITFYKSTAAILFWQTANQSFNALVNYTNSNATTEVSNNRLLTAYLSATSSAVVVALGLKRVLATRSSPMLQRFVPFAAVAAANAVNIPMMRQSEIVDGVTVFDEDGNPAATSRYAAVKGITQVVTSRQFIVAPSMLILPVFMERLEKTAPFRRYGWLSITSQILFSGMFLRCTVPTGCAIFPQSCSITVDQLPKAQVEQLRQKYHGVPLPQKLYFNKGL